MSGFKEYNFDFKVLFTETEYYKNELGTNLADIRQKSKDLEKIKQTEIENGKLTKDKGFQWMIENDRINRENERKIHKLIDEKVTSLIDNYNHLRKQIILISSSTHVSNKLEYINYITSIDLDKIFTDLALKEFSKSIATIFDLLNKDELDKIESKLSQKINELWTKSSFDILLCHISMLLMTMIKLFDKLEKGSEIDFILLFCHGDYHTIIYKYPFLIDLLNGDLSGYFSIKNTSLITGQMKNKEQYVKNTTDTHITLSYDITDTSLSMLRTFGEIDIFLGKFGKKIQRACIINCLNCDTYSYMYNNKKCSKLDNSFREFVAKEYISPIITRLIDGGEIWAIGGDSYKLKTDFVPNVDNLIEIFSGHLKNQQTYSILKYVPLSINSNLKGGAKRHITMKHKPNLNRKSKKIYRHTKRNKFSNTKKTMV